MLSNTIQSMDYYHYCIQFAGGCPVKAIRIAYSLVYSNLHKE